jgi:hypothetical protein
MAHPTLRKTGRVTLWVVGTIVVLPFALVTLVFAALLIPPLRAFAVQKGVGIANENLGGYTVKVKAVDRIDPWGINIRGVQMFDEQKRELVSVPWAMVRIRPWSLLNNTLRLTRVEIDGVRAHIYPADPNKPPEPEEPPSEPSTFVIRVDHARIRDARAETTWDDRTIKAVIGTLAAGGQYGPKPALALEQANVRVTADNEVLLQLRTTEGAWRADKGGRVGLVASVAGAPLTLHADLPAMDDMAPWPLKQARLVLRDVDRRALALLGVQDGAELKVPVDLTVDARNVDERLEVSARVRAGGSRKTAAIDLFATADADAYEAAVAIAPTQLSSVAGILPVLQVQGKLHARATPTNKMPDKVTLTWNGVAVDGGAIPAGVVRAELPLPVVRLNSLTLAGLEDELKVDGEFNTDTSRGRVDIAFHQLALDTIEYLKRQGMAGVLDGGISTNVTTSTITADSDLKVRNFKHPSAQLASLDLGVAVSGKLASPQGHITLQIKQLAAGKYKLDQVGLDALATPSTLSGKLDLSGPDTKLKAEIGGQRGADGSLRAQGIGRGVVVKKDLSFDLRELHYGERGLALQELALRSGKQGLRVSGTLDKQDRVTANAQLANVDLGEWAALGGVTGLVGKLSGDVKLAGTTADPIVDTRLRLQQVRYKSDLPIDGTFTARGDLGERKLDADLAVHSSDELGARIDVSVAVPMRPLDLAKAVQYSRVAMNASVYMPVAQISAIAGDDMAGLEGMLDAKMRAEGTLDDPQLVADITAALKLPEQEGEAEEGIRITANIDKSKGELGVWAKDKEGELVTVNGFAEWPGGSPRAAIDHPEGWRNAKFKAQAELKPRRLDTMQGVFAYFTKIYALSLPLRTSAKLDFDGEQGKLGGGAQLGLVVYGDKLDGRCKIGAQSSVDFDAKLRQDRIEVDIKANTDGGGSIRGNLSSVLALNALSGEDPVIGPAKLQLNGKAIAIHKMPGLCNLAGGLASFDVEATGLGKQKPELDLTATINDLHAAGVEAIRVEAKAHVGGPKATVDAKLASQKRQVGTITASVPLTYPDDITPTVLPDTAIAARVQLDKLLLANVLSFTETLGRVGGSVSTDLNVTGKVSDPYAVGYVELEDVNVSVASIAQPFRDINGRIDIKGRSVNIKKLTTRDRGGKLTMQGYATLRQDMTGDGGLYLEADKFPLRQQGTIIGELTTRARADFKIPADLKAKAELKIIDGRIWLTGDRGKSVQSLDPHPDVRFSDEKVEQESTPAEEQAEGTPGLTLGSFKMKTENPLWLMHKDFSLQVGVDIALLQGESGPKLEGEATLVRGELKLLGKPFKLKDGVIRFAGGMPPDPELDIKAVFKPPTGRELLVTVSGRGSAPVLEFSGAATTAGEAVALLTGVGSGKQSKGGAEGDASSQMAGIAADMTAGLLVMTARREFGDWVPMISIETGASGEPTGASASFDASKLIPPWAQGFARGAYVEGIFGSQGTSSGGGSRGLGVKLEVALPRDFITSLGYGPGPGWSTDVAWSP